jgi:hypothetical protein
VIGVQHLLCLAQIFFGAAFHAPWHAQQPVQIVAHNRGFGRHRRHGFQLFQLRLCLFARFLGKLRLGDARLKFGHLVLAILAVTQFLLNGLHLLIQVIFALGALHLAFHAGLDLFLDIQDAHFALHVAKDLFKPQPDVQRFQKFLLLRDTHPQMACGQIGQTRRFARFRYGSKGLFGDVLLDLGVAFKFLGHGAHQRLDRFGIAGKFGQASSAGLEKLFILNIFGDAHTLLALDKNLDGAVGQLEQLQHICQHAGLVYAFGGGFIDRGVDLAGQKDLAIICHHLFQRAHGFFTTHEQGHDHMGEHHDIAQRQHRIAGGKGLFHHISLHWQEGNGPDHQQPGLPHFGLLIWW